MRIMLVEDDQTAGISLTRALMGENYVVNLVTDGQTALDVAKVYPYDLILLNLMLTDGEGIQLCESLRGGGYKGSIFMVSRSASPGTKVNCLRGMDAGANDCLANPYNVEELLSRVQILLKSDNRTYVSKF